MTQDNPLLLGGVLALAGWVWWTWWRDLRAWRPGRDDAQTLLPGAAPCRTTLLLLGVAGAMLILAIEVGGEYALGITAQQTDMTVLFAAYSIAAAPLLEELIFRGLLFYDGGGRAALWASIVAFSALFALGHQHVIVVSLEDWVTFELGTKGLFSTAILFVNSVWFYYLRFARRNPRRSLLPCLLAHAASNAGVVATKSIQGHIAGWY